MATRVGRRNRKRQALREACFTSTVTGTRPGHTATPSGSSVPLTRRAHDHTKGMCMAYGGDNSAWHPRRLPLRHLLIILHSPPRWGAPSPRRATPPAPPHLAALPATDGPLLTTGAAARASGACSPVCGAATRTREAGCMRGAQAVAAGGGGGSGLIRPTLTGRPQPAVTEQGTRAAGWDRHPRAASTVQLVFARVPALL